MRVLLLSRSSIILTPLRFSLALSAGIFLFSYFPVLSLSCSLLFLFSLLSSPLPPPLPSSLPFLLLFPSYLPFCFSFISLLRFLSSALPSCRPFLFPLYSPPFPFRPSFLTSAFPSYFLPFPSTALSFRPLSFSASLSFHFLLISCLLFSLPIPHIFINCQASNVTASVQSDHAPSALVHTFLQW